MKSKVKARENRDADKIKAEGTETLALACFDPEAVLPTPHSFQSCLNYKRGLNTYNFTLYYLGTSDRYSYIWNEATAGRGACEIASCVYNYIEYMSQQNGMEDYILIRQ